MKHFQRAVWLALALALMMPLAAQAAPGVLDRAIELISVMESSANYGSVANDANGSPSVGILQWNNTRAVELLKKIISDDADAARSILGAKLYAELTEGDAYVWSEKELGDAQKKAVGRLLRTDAGIRRQDEQSLYDVLTYVNRGRSLGIVNPGALVYYAAISHQVGIGGARKYAAQAAEVAGGYEKIALEDLHAVGLAIGPNTRTRRNRVYESLLKKQAVDDGAPPESVQIDVPEEQVLYL
ncbi:MAG: hypothetical protein GX558_03045, partial [Clostridiales bacterium]|nr:hypothetical protein [Clostridiales bacterium]